MKSLFLTVLLALTAFASQANQTRYISDDLEVFVHSGPSNKYRIIGTLIAGEQVELLEQDLESGYSKITDERGRSGWTLTDKLQATQSLKSRLPVLESQLEQAHQAQQAAEEEAERLRAQLNQVEQDHQKQADYVATLERNNRSLEQELATKDESNLMRRYMYGALTLLGGILFGIIVTFLPRRRKQSDQWM